MNLTSSNVPKRKLTLLNQPYLIELKTQGTDDTGLLTVAEQTGDIPFDIKRVYWTYGVPEDHTRGHHAHFTTQQVLVAAAGTIIVELEGVTDKEKTTFVLDSPQVGLYIPPKTWRILQYFDNAIQIVFASIDYSEEDYIRNYDAFKRLNLFQGS
ncbi:MAG: FdtA/QdtA family cupin domain-containing protein [Thermonemataceae bacterium]